MQLIDGQPTFSATDLVGFLECEHLADLELAALGGLVARPVREDATIDLLAKRGEEHEQRYLADLRGKGRVVTEISRERTDDWPTKLRSLAAETEAAMRRGDDVIFQAAFFDGQWLGFADFLLRLATPSDLGSWSYEVHDTKLARHTKAGALLQLCGYSEHVARIQGRLPERMHVALGGFAREIDTCRVADYIAYYRGVKRHFEEVVARAAPPLYPPPTTYPEPVEHCDVCRWVVHCRDRRRHDDDLSLVAGATSRQRLGLKARDIATRRGLATLVLPLSPPLDGTSRDALARIQAQADIQVRGEAEGRTIWEFVEPNRTKDGALEPNRGLLALPEPSPGDLFLDLEGDPFAFVEGIDYLFGILEPGRPDPATGEPTFHAFWARDDDGRVGWAGEKRAFEAAVDLVIDRLDRDPAMHVYHYAAYEPTAFGRLAQRHATREDEVDRLLRGKVFVDLFRVVRQGIRASVESYSIKRLEPLYGFERTVELKDANSSILEFEAWMEAGGERGDDPATLAAIEAYNRDDVVSNRLLRNWLEARRPDLAGFLGEAELPRLPPEPASAGEELTEQLERVAEVARRLEDGVPDDPAERSAEEQGRWLVAQLLSWHRREDKSTWWRFFHLLENLTDEELIEAGEPIGGLEFVDVVGETRQSYLYRYRFPPQEHECDPGVGVHDPATGKPTGSVFEVDDAARTVVIKRSKTSDAPHPTAIVPLNVFSTKEHRSSLLRIGQWVAEHGIDAEGGPYRAARHLLMRREPRLRPEPAGPLATPVQSSFDLLGDGARIQLPDEEDLAAARRTVLRLDGTTLPIQGPPGSGKTYTGARMIVDLVAAGKRVGVTANSHKVIGNLLDEVALAAREAGRAVRIGQKRGSDADACTHEAARCFDANDEALGALVAGEIDVLGGTSWLWAREQFASTVDVLFIDEAGQMSLANAIAVSQAADSLVLLGDPQQLDQPIQGCHPPGAERSALAHILGDEATMPEHHGLFIERTWRLHPAICDFTSEVFYDGKLQPEAGMERQALRGPAPFDGVGVRFVAVRHDRRQNESPEEAEEVARIWHALVDDGATWTDARGRTRPIGPPDVVIVAPYNAQVSAIAARLPPEARVGTVDKFQGQQAPVSIYSMATSDPELAPRGMEFLYSLNRLNVATSRARCLAIVVASPGLVRVRCRTPRQMRLANALSRFVELAEVPSTAG